MDFITQNGQKEVKITPASFAAASNLKKAAMQAIDTKNIKIDNLDEIKLSKFLDLIINSIINLDTSDFFEKAIFECLSVCIYDGFYKITPQLFDDKPEIREDYYEIVTRCAEVNLRPFFKSLVSEFKTRLQTIKQEDQKSQ